MLRKKELEWFYHNGCSFIYPDAWEKYLEPIPESEQSNLIKSYYKKLTSDDMNERITAAKASLSFKNILLAIVAGIFLSIESFS